MKDKEQTPYFYHRSYNAINDLPITDSEKFLLNLAYSIMDDVKRNKKRTFRPITIKQIISVYHFHHKPTSIRNILVKLKKHRYNLYSTKLELTVETFKMFRKMIDYSSKPSEVRDTKHTSRSNTLTPESKAVQSNNNKTIPQEVYDYTPGSNTLYPRKYMTIPQEVTINSQNILKDDNISDISNSDSINSIDRRNQVEQKVEQYGTQMCEQLSVERPIAQPAPASTEVILSKYEADILELEKKMSEQDPNFFKLRTLIKEKEYNYEQTTY